MDRKSIDVSCVDYKEFIEKDLYYVDKTLLVRDVLQNGGKVILFTRPQGFGKTLALSMLQTFFEREPDQEKAVLEKRAYFTGKKICDCGEKILSHMGQYPVIHLSFKEGRQPDFLSAYLGLRKEIQREYARHEYLKDSERLCEEDRHWFRFFLEGASFPVLTAEGLSYEAQKTEALMREAFYYSSSLNTLCKLLSAHHGREVIILLDDIHIPLRNAFEMGFYEQMADFLGSLWTSALTSNEALNFGVLTGQLPIPFESSFSELDIVLVNSVRSSWFKEAFGFTQEEPDFVRDCEAGEVTKSASEPNRQSRNLSF